MTRSDFTTPEEVNEVYRRRARFYDWSVNAYYLIGFRWWAYLIWERLFESGGTAR